jgi:hypothetical protein
VHTCSSGKEVLDQEDIIQIGNSNDYTGSQTTDVNKVKYAGTEVRNWGTRSFIEGERIPGKLSVRGKQITKYRQRQHLEYIEKPDEESI